MFRIAMCDDDKAYISYLQEMINDLKSVDMEIQFYEYYSGENLLENCPKDVDLLILDIQMDGIDGNETAQKFREKNAEAILIFCSGVAQPTLETCKAQPSAYLLKDFPQEKLENELRQILNVMLEKTRRQKVFISQKNGQSCVDVDEILYVEYYKRVSRLYLYMDGRVLEMESRHTLKEMYEKLREYGFEYAHNSYIVNLWQVQSLDEKSEMIVFKQGIRLKMSRSKRSLFQNRWTNVLRSRRR